MPSDGPHFLGLLAVCNATLFALHALRARITLGPLFALAGVLAVMLWQLLQLGWWVSWSGLQINAALVAIVPALLAGAALAHAFDGLRTARAYVLVVVVIGLIAWAFATFRRTLGTHVPLPYVFEYSPLGHLGLTIAFVLGGVTVFVLYELLRRAIHTGALPLAHLGGVLAWLAASSFIEYGLDMGSINIRRHAPEFLLFSLVPAGGLALYGLYAGWRGALMPPRPLAEVLRFWRAAPSNAPGGREDITSAAEIVSDLQRLNAQLREAERVSSYQVMMATLGILSTDAEGRVTRANPIAQEIFQRAEAALRGMRLAALLAEHGAGPLALSELAGKSEGVTLRLQAEGRPERWYDVSGIALHGERRRLAGYNVLFKDATGREVAQRRRLIESRVRGIHQTGRVLAHDFSNLLIGAQSSLEVLGAEAEGESPARGTIEQIRKALSRCRDMLGQLGALQLVGTPNLKRLNVVELAREACGICANTVREKRIEFAVAGVEGEIWVDCDGTQIVRVLTNLINNAVRATAEGGAIELALARGASGVAIEVRDTGIGMGAEEIARAFDPGYSTKAGGQGGLGLSISYLIVDAHGGSLRLEPAQPGLRSIVWLPYSAGAAAGRLLNTIVAIADETRCAGIARELEFEGECEVAEALTHEEVRALIEEDPRWQALVLEDEALLDGLPDRASALCVASLGPGREAPRLVRTGEVPAEAAEALLRALRKALQSPSGAPAPT